MLDRPRERKLTIIGGGIIAALEAWHFWRKHKDEGKALRVTVYEKNPSLTDTTTAHLVPSLTPDEIIAVVPRGEALSQGLQKYFSEPDGIRVDDVAVMNENTDRFIQLVREYGKDDAGHEARTRNLLELGKTSMALWQDMFDKADDELKAILLDANFHPCKELSDPEHPSLDQGYRIDLLYNMPWAHQKAEMMKSAYEGLGYQNCRLLSPAEVMKMDPMLRDFCIARTTAKADGTLEWQDDTVALFRPGGCIDTSIFLPKFYDYLRRQMGQYQTASGKLKDCFRLRFEREVTGIEYLSDAIGRRVHGLHFFDRVKRNKHFYPHSDYVFCPGESVGTLDRLGLSEPAWCGFAGASLRLHIPVPDDQRDRFQSLNHCMEVHGQGIVLAWQARIIDGAIFIGVAGTKAFYGDQKPGREDAFTRDRTLVQLNMINDVLPELVSLAFQQDTAGISLTEEDLRQLEAKGIAECWAGTRSVAYDNFPTMGPAFDKASGEKIQNTRCTTHLGSGGVSFGPVCVETSNGHPDEEKSETIMQARTFGSSLRA